MKKYLLRYKISNSLVIIAIFVLALVQVGTSLVHTFAFNSLLQGSFKNFIGWYAGGTLLWLIYIVGHHFLDVGKSKIIQDMIVDMRQDYADIITSTTFSSFRSKAVGEYISILNKDMDIIEVSGFQSIYNLISTVFLTLLSLVALLAFDYRIMLITIFLTLVLTFLPSTLTGRIEKATENFSKNNSLFLTKIQDIIQGYETLYYLGDKKKINNQISTASLNFKESKVEYTRESSLVNSFISIISVLSQVIIMVSTGYLAFMGLVSFGAITSTASVAGNVFSSLSSFSQYQMSIKSVKPLVNKINAEKQLEESDKKDMAVQLADIEEIDINSLSFGFNENLIFQGLDLKIESGKKYALVGPSGSGKSTLLQIILGNIRDFKGEVKFNKKDLKEVDEKEIIKNISFVSNRSHIYQDTLLNNITLWEDYSEDEINRVIKASNLEELSDRLNEFINEKELSEGQKQRVGLARAFLRNKKFIILDEATANIDGEFVIISDEMVR